ncbi:MAG: ankyrin repeat domain-containing protein, partial [Candidatus Hydrogenedentes bacterium]|nr:ankyrin repeat domain-containing protein [Candidatus Hydrogenedentota bacterium]
MGTRGNNPTSIDDPKKYCSDTNHKISSSEDFAQREYDLVGDSLSSANHVSQLVLSSTPKSSSCYSIQDAIIQNDTTYIEGYLSAGGDINITDLYDKTLLHYAIETGQIDMIDFLLAKGANPYGLFYDPAKSQGYEDTPLFAAYELQNDCEFAPSLCTAILTVIVGAAATVDTDSTSVVNYMANDNVSGIMNVLASGAAIRREVMEQLSWYALENSDLTLFAAAIQHP